MLPKVLSILPRKRFEDAGVYLPPELEFHFEDAVTEEAIISACRRADFLFLPAAYPHITRHILENIPSIRMIQSAGTGFDKVDVKSAAEFNIPVANSPGQNTTTVAELTIAMLIVLQRRIIPADRQIKEGHYASVREGLFGAGLKELCNTRLGLVGLGAIGKKVAQIAGLLGAHVSYFDIQQPEENIKKKLRVSYKDFDDLLRSSDAISLHIPLSDQTRNIIGKREFKLMPQGALLVNTARGEIVDQQALAEALENNLLGGAAIDTLSPEPPPPEHPLLNLSPAARDLLLITPHIAGTTKGAFNRMLNAALQNIVDVAAGGDPKNVVNGIFKAKELASR
jgi:phosphoglycerate dehydrogenase-like enzyme